MPLTFYCDEMLGKKWFCLLAGLELASTKTSLQLRSPPPLGLAVAPFTGQAGQAFAANGGNLHHHLLHWDM